MQLRQLEIFLAVARFNSFSKAAENMFLAQPTVSSHIRLLEEELNVKLFVRSTKELSLTPEGQVLYAYASQIVNFCERARSELKEISGEQQSHMTVAASSVPSQYFLPRILGDVRKRYPAVCVKVLQGDSAYATKAVQNGEAEVGIVGSRDNKPHLTYFPIVEEKLVAATPNTPYFRAMKGVMNSDVLQNYPFIMREEGSGTRRNTEEFLLSIGVSPDKMQVAAELTSTESVMRGIESGLGISIVSKLAADYFTAAGNILLFDFDSPLMIRQFFMLVREDVPLSGAARYMTELLTPKDA